MGYQIPFHAGISRSTECHSSHSFHMTCQIWHTAMLDRFVTKMKYKLSVFFHQFNTLMQRNAMAVQVLNIQCEALFGYAYC